MSVSVRPATIALATLGALTTGFLGELVNLEIKSYDIFLLLIIYSSQLMQPILITSDEQIPNSGRTLNESHGG